MSDLVKENLGPDVGDAPGALKKFIEEQGGMDNIKITSVENEDGTTTDFKFEPKK